MSPLKFALLILLLGACALAGCAGDDRPAAGWASYCYTYRHYGCEVSGWGRTDTSRSGQVNAP